MAAYNGSGLLIAHYVYGLGLVSQTGPSGTGYYDFDASGNTVGITGLSGSYVNQYSYLPFGETTAVSAALPNPFTFAGQLGVTQIDANLFSMRARIYAPAMGQFSSKDPSGLNGGDANLRRYAGNDPADFVDPSGRGVFAYAGGVAGAAAGTSIGTALGTWIDSTLGTSPAASDALGQAGGEAGLAAGRAVGQKIDDTLGTGGSGGRCG